MKLAALGNAVVALAVFGAFGSSASGASVAYVAPANASNSNATLPTGTAYTSNLGYAFKTGPSGSFDIDWVKVGLYSSASSGTSLSFKISLRNTDNETAYSAVAGTTEHAADTVNFTVPASGNFDLNLTSAELPNITSHKLLANSAYALFVNSAAGGHLGLRRTTGFANGTTNAQYTVSNGFTVLDTFRNNTANYTNTPGSHPTLDISFGGEVSAVPETSNMAFLAILLGSGLVRRQRARR
jgi:hypothetical protein